MSHVPGPVLSLQLEAFGLVFHTTPFILLLSGNMAEEPVSLRLPDNVVKGSARASISIAGK